MLRHHAGVLGVVRRPLRLRGGERRLRGAAPAAGQPRQVLRAGQQQGAGVTNNQFFTYILPTDQQARDCMVDITFWCLWASQGHPGLQRVRFSVPREPAQRPHRYRIAYFSVVRADASRASAFFPAQRMHA